MNDRHPDDLGAQNSAYRLARVKNKVVSRPVVGKSSEDKMGITIKARFTNGVLDPLEDPGLREGEEVTVTIESSIPKPDPDWLEHTAGGWVGLVDAEALKRHIRESRMVNTRPIPRLKS